jgi:hypothetical protein
MHKDKSNLIHQFLTNTLLLKPFKIVNKTKINIGLKLNKIIRISKINFLIIYNYCHLIGKSFNPRVECSLL